MQGPTRCTECSYDLRGDPEADRCPECGAPMLVALGDFIVPEVLAAATRILNSADIGWSTTETGSPVGVIMGGADPTTTVWVSRDDLERAEHLLETLR